METIDLFSNVLNTSNPYSKVLYPEATTETQFPLKEGILFFQNFPETLLHVTCSMDANTKCLLDSKFNYYSDSFLYFPESDYKALPRTYIFARLSNIGDNELYIAVGIDLDKIMNQNDVYLSLNDNSKFEKISGLNLQYSIIGKYDSM